jgi:hypothetical protein
MNWQVRLKARRENFAAGLLARHRLSCPVPEPEEQWPTQTQHSADRLAFLQQSWELE